MLSSCRKAGRAGPASARRAELSPHGAAARRAGTVVAVALAYAACAAPGYAATNWNYDPRIEVGGIYDDNYLLGETAADQFSVIGPFVTASVDLHGMSPRNDLVITPLVHATLFPGHSEDQSTDGYLNLTDTFNTLRTKSVVRAGYANQTVSSADFVSATFPNVQLGEPAVTGSGLVVHLERQQSVHFDPSTSIRFSDRGHFDLSADYLKAWFSQTLPGQVGFQSIAATAGVGYAASQRSDVAVRAQYIGYEPEGNAPNSRHGTVFGEWNYAESTILRFYARAGVGETRGTNISTNDQVTLTNFEGGIGAHWTYQITDVVIDLLQTATPSSYGVLVTQQEARFRAMRRFSPMVAGFFALRGFHTSPLETGQTNVPARYYGTGSAGLEWRLNRDYSLDASYTYTYQKYKDDPLHAASNTVGVSIVYEPHRYDRLPEPGPVGSESPY